MIAPRSLMRLAACFAVSALLCSQAVADDVPAPPTELEMQAARAITASFTDPEMVETMANSDYQARQNEIRGPLLTGPFYENLRPETQRALTAFVDEKIPQIVREETHAMMARLDEELPPRLAERFTESELTSLAAIYAHPSFRAALSSYARGETPPGSPPPIVDPELQAIFEAGRANGMPHHWDVIAVVGVANASIQQEMRPRVEQRFLREVCTVLADECPVHVRQRITPAPD